MLIKDIKDPKYKEVIMGIKNNKTVTKACKDAGVTPQAFYKWKNATPERIKLYDDIRETLTDHVEMALYRKCVDDKDTKAIVFWLESMRPSKWGKKKPVEEIKKESSGEVKDKIKNIFGLTDEDIDKMEGLPGLN